MDEFETLAIELKRVSQSLEALADSFRDLKIWILLHEDTYETN